MCVLVVREQFTVFKYLFFCWWKAFRAYVSLLAALKSSWLSALIITLKIFSSPTRTVSAISSKSLGRAESTIHVLVPSNFVKKFSLVSGFWLYLPSSKGYLSPTRQRPRPVGLLLNPHWKFSFPSMKAGVTLPSISEVRYSISWLSFHLQTEYPLLRRCSFWQDTQHLVL